MTAIEISNPSGYPDAWVFMVDGTIGTPCSFDTPEEALAAALAAIPDSQETQPMTTTPSADLFEHGWADAHGEYVELILFRDQQEYRNGWIVGAVHVLADDADAVVVRRFLAAQNDSSGAAIDDMVAQILDRIAAAGGPEAYLADSGHITSVLERAAPAARTAIAGLGFEQLTQLLDDDRLLNGEPSWSLPEVLDYNRPPDSQETLMTITKDDGDHYTAHTYFALAPDRCAQSHRHGTRHQRANAAVHQPSLCRGSYGA